MFDAHRVPGVRSGCGATEVVSAWVGVFERVKTLTRASRHAIAARQVVARHTIGAVLDKLSAAVRYNMGRTVTNPSSVPENGVPGKTGSPEAPV